MKIIKEGNLEYVNCNVYRLECSNCGCIFVFDCGDFTARERKLDGNAYVRCPYCNKELQFKPSECLNDEEVDEELENE